jgi:hypothetical protein
MSAQTEQRSRSSDWAIRSATEESQFDSRQGQDIYFSQMSVPISEST